jgi:hypothetical protein
MQNNVESFVFKLFTLVLMTLLLSSCGGGGQGTASLSITRGFVLGNTSFSGGVYITGEKVGGGENFAAAISAGNTANVTINFGNWNIKVVGWDGGTMQTGTPYCKYVSNFAFTTAGQQLEINTTTADCFDGTNISGTNQHQSASTFKNIVVSTCGAQYNPSFSNLTTANGYADPCVTGNYPFEYQKKYQYFKLHLENEVNTGARTPGIASTCLSAQTLGQSVKFPNRMPVTVKFYTDSACSQEVDSFRFKKGLDFSLSEGRGVDKFDWSVTADSVSFFVHLPTGASKRLSTAFHTEVPTFKCLESGKLIPCGKLPAVSTNTYYLDPNKYAVIKVPGVTCGTISPSGVSLTQYSCDNFKGSAYIGLKVTTSSPVNGSFSMNGTTYQLKVGNVGTYNQDQIREAYKLLKRTVGFGNSTNMLNSLADDFDEEENDQLGGLASAVYDISALGAGGVFYDYYDQCTTGAIAPETRTYFKNGIQYTASISAISGVTPAFIARADQPEWQTDENRFNRRLVIRKLVGPSYTTEKMIDVSCDNFDTDPMSYLVNDPQVRTGTMEEQRTYSIGTKDYVIKRRILWNTASSDTGRFDIYRSKEIYIGSTPQTRERNFYRVAKSKSDNYNHFKAHGMTYLAVRDGSSFDESIVVTEVDGKDSGGDMNYAHKQLMHYKIENTTIGTIFDQTFAAEMSKIRYAYNDGQDEQEQSKIAAVGNHFIQMRRKPGKVEYRYTNGSSIVSSEANYVPDNMAADISDDGNQKIAAFNYMNTIYYVVVINGNENSGTVSTGTDPLNIKVGILNDGTFIVAYIDSGSNQFHWKLSGAGLQNSPYTSYTHKSFDITKDSTRFFLNIARTDGSFDQRLDLCKINTSTSCGFNTYANRNATGHFTYSTAKYNSGFIETTYIQDGVINQTRVTIGPSVFTGGTQYQYPDRDFTFFQASKYHPVSSTEVLRTTTGTPIETDYFYYRPTISNFQMVPAYLQQSKFDGFFTSSFTSLTN